jgi:hypothetical protein
MAYLKLSERVSELVNNTPPSRLLFPLRDLAREALVRDYSRDEVLEALEEAREQLAKQGEEEREDAVLEVMDFLYGWCSPHVKL